MINKMDKIKRLLLAMKEWTSYMKIFLFLKLLNSVILIIKFLNQFLFKL